jgi:hypothetical protein
MDRKRFDALGEASNVPHIVESFNVPV